MRGNSFVWEALAEARRDNLSEAGEAPPVPGGDGVGRRAVLGALAAAAGAATLFPREAHARSVGTIGAGGPVVIVGGGIAGLSALWHLTQAGIDARLFEARTRLGGRIYTERAPGRPLLEVGGQLVNTDHADMLALTRTFGVDLIDRKAGAHRTMIVDGGYELPRARLVAGLRGIAGQIDRDAKRLDAGYARVAAELDRMSFTSYLDRHARLMPEPWVRGLLEASARTEYGVEPGHASALQLIFNLPVVDGERVEVLSNSDERFLMSGGSSSIVAAMAARLKDRITTFRRVTRIDPAGPGSNGAGARVRFASGETLDAAAVIVTVPASIMSRIDYGVPLPPLWRRFIAEVGLGKVGKVQVATGGRVWDAAPGRGGELWQADARTGVSLGWDGSVHRRGERPTSDGVWTWFTGGDQVAAADAGNARETALRFAAAVEPALPGMVQATGGYVRRTQWHREPLTMGGYVNYRPGQLTRFAPLIWTEADGVASVPTPAGPIWFAGEHLSDAFPGYMNGGAQTGRLAAQAVATAWRTARAAA